jgi:hypothetical protein
MGQCVVQFPGQPLTLAGAHLCLLPLTGRRPEPRGGPERRGQEQERQALSQLGTGAARHPWRVIAAWLLAAIAFGGPTADAITAPGLDSGQAAQLVQRAGTGQQEVTAQVVVTPIDTGRTFFDHAAPCTALARLQAELRRLPHVLAASDPVGALDQGADAAVRGGLVSTDGRIAVVRVQYPDRDQLSAKDLNALVTLGNRLRGELPLRIEMGGDLFYRFSSGGNDNRELIGILAAAAILVLAFGCSAGPTGGSPDGWTGSPPGPGRYRRRSAHRTRCCLLTSHRSARHRPGWAMCRPVTTCLRDRLQPPAFARVRGCGRRRHSS